MILHLHPKGGHYCESEMRAEIGRRFSRNTEIYFRKDVVILDCRAVGNPSEVRAKAKNIPGIARIEYNSGRKIFPFKKLNEKIPVEPLWQ